MSARKFTFKDAFLRRIDASYMIIASLKLSSTITPKTFSSKRSLSVPSKRIMLKILFLAKLNHICSRVSSMAPTTHTMRWTWWSSNWFGIQSRRGISYRTLTFNAASVCTETNQSLRWWSHSNFTPYSIKSSRRLALILISMMMTMKLKISSSENFSKS